MSQERSIAVTGAAGFIGSRVVKLLEAEHPEWSITAIDNFYLGTVREIDDVSVKHVDIRQRSALADALDGSDIVLHLAAISGVDDCTENPDLAYEVNVTGTNNIAWFCRKTGAGLVFPFSMAVLGDPDTFPISVDNERDPFNWYGRTKLLGERAIESFAADSFPAHLLLKSNLYGAHEINGQRISKGTVINFFINRAMSGEPLTVYEPGTQARNYIHVDDVAWSYVRSAERLSTQLTQGQTGIEKYEIASNEDPGVMTVAETVQNVAAEELGRDVDITLVENPRAGDETLVEEFTVDISNAQNTLGWTPTHSIEDSVHELISEYVTADGS